MDAEQLGFDRLVGIFAMYFVAAFFVLQLASPLLSLLFTTVLLRR
jgi:hypothetical protein